MTQPSGFLPPALSEDVQSLLERDEVSLAGISKHRLLPLAVVGGSGCWLIEAGGRRLLDLNAFWTSCALGHGHPAIVAAVGRAIRTSAGAGSGAAANPSAVALAEDLVARVPGIPDPRVYLGHAGTDANHVAIRACQHATGRRRVLAFERSYHGGFGGGRGASGLLTDAAEGDVEARFVPYPDPVRPRFGDPGAEAATSLTAVQQVLRAGDTACVIVEPLLSDGGFVIPPAGFLKDLHELCTRYGVPMICDEVKVGLGRTGLLHAFEHDLVTPDLVTFGKALGGGLPLSAAVGPAHILDRPAASVLMTATGNPVCAEVGRAVLATLRDEGLTERAAALGSRLLTGLREVAAGADAGGSQVAERIGDVRGRGLAIAVDLVRDQATMARDSLLAETVVRRAWELGAVVHHVGGNVLEITPPLVMSESEVDQAIEILGRSITDAVRAKASKS